MSDQNSLVDLLDRAEHIFESVNRLGNELEATQFFELLGRKYEGPSEYNEFRQATQDLIRGGTLSRVRTTSSARFQTLLRNWTLKI